MGKINTQNKFVVYSVSTFAIILWGMSYIWLDDLIDMGVPIFYFLFIRIILAGLVLLVFNAVRHKIVKIQKKDIPLFLLLSFLEPFLYFMTETYGIKVTGSPTLSAMIIASIPIFSVIAGRMFFNERINWLNGAGILLSLGGICLVVMGGEGELGPHFIWGIVMLVIAVLTEVGHSSVIKLLADKYESPVIVMYQYMIGSIFFLPLFLTYGITDFQPFYFSKEVWIPILCLAVLCSSVAFSIWAYTIKSLGVAKASIFIALIPVAAAVVAWMLGSECLSTHQWIGIAVSTAGVIMSQIVIKKKQ